MRKSLYFILFTLSLLFTGCNRNTFRVSGIVTGAEGQLLYLEHMGLPATTTLDSCRIGRSGKFSFRQPSPGEPDLYRLRLADRAGQAVLLAVDSTEHIRLNAKADSLLMAEVDGSDKTRQLAALRLSARTQPMAEHKVYARSLILSDPKSQVAYYALFQRRAGQPVFDPLDSDDQKLYRAVATAWHTWYPASKRGEVLYQQVLELIRAERRAENAAAVQAFMAEQENAFLDITLPDEEGVERSLSAFRGRPILLDFVSADMPQYAGYLFEMKEIWNTYHSRGLEIYSVYPDPAKLAWEDRVRALPWTTVRTENGLRHSCFSLYNVQQLPTIFLYDRSGQIVSRVGSFDELRKQLNSILK